MSTATIHSPEGANGPTNGIPLVERIDPAPDAVGVFRCLSRLPHAIFLDSAMRDGRLGRYSFVAADPVEWVEVPVGARLSPTGWMWPALDWRAAIRHDLPPFQGGWAGLFSYELGRIVRGVSAAPVDEFQIPALAIGLYDVVVAFDHQKQAAWIISQGLPEKDGSPRRDRAAARLASFRAILDNRANAHGKTEQTGGNSKQQWHRSVSSEELSHQTPIPTLDGLRSNFSPDAYLNAVRRTIEYIRAGDVFQVNLAQRLLAPANGSSVELYCRLRERNPAPFAAYFDIGDWQICSASPERFMQVHDRRVETRPIKGTRPRGDSEPVDRRTAEELLNSAKDRAENVMIVDLLRNDLSQTCRPDSVRVSQLCGLESFASVHHLVSVIEGQLRDGQTPWHLLNTCLPGGSVTGAPKLRAMEIISELEPNARGAYCGALGYIGIDGRMDTSVLIRTITAGRGWWQLPVGGGIVSQSNADDEYAETWYKAKAMLAAMLP